ncbi:MAG: nucleotidyltransferase domain-containing protein [Eubacterium sp.]|nr:nucleotidyltransferase domain-containing protein [Eubacterium sp.]
MALKLKSTRHAAALDYAMNKIKSSVLEPYINDVILFGSCARREEKFSSDVDLLLVLKLEYFAHPELKKILRLLKSDITSDDIRDPEVDLKIVVGEDQWKNSDMSFYKNIAKEGVTLWH